MGGWTAGLMNELRLMQYRNKTIIFLLLSILIPPALIALFHALQPVIGIIAVSPAYPVQMLEFYTAVWIPLFIVLEVAELFPQEISSRTLKLALLRPITRLGAFTAKFLALGTAIAAVLLILGLASTLCNIIFGTPGSGSLHLADLCKAYIAAFLSMWSLSALFVLTAQFFRSAGGFIVFAILLYAGAKALPLVMNGFSSFSVTSYTSSYTLWLSHSATAGQLATSSLFLLSGLILCSALGYFFFEKKEV